VSDLSLPPYQSDLADMNGSVRSPSNVRGRTIQRATKRVLDLIASLLHIVVMIPFVSVIAIAIAIDSRGPVLFVQRRVGRSGREFPLIKFRTMVVDGEAALALHVGSDSELLQEWERSRKLREDPRVTSVGRFLRKHSIDELPQLINVLWGNMSLVGPRPVRQDEIAYFGERSTEILSVRPGLTGLWAVNGRSDVSYVERAEFEYQYAVGWSLWMDFRILAQTLPVVLHGHGAY
jgi:exopolysaccharide production protein ExoY